MSTAPYKTLRHEAADEVIINKSRFIGYACPCETEEEALAFLNKIRTKHKDATHNCYAYVIGKNSGIMRYSDDGEPGGTAGLPMMEVLKAQGVVNCCVVVTRYFGGILLGAGGLARAYARGARDAVNAAGICRFSKVFVAKTDIPYSLFPKAEFEIGTRDFRVTGKEFGENVTLTLLLSEGEREALSALLSELSGGKITVVTVGETYAEDRENS